MLSCSYRMWVIKLSLSMPKQATWVSSRWNQRLSPSRTWLSPVRWHACSRHQWLWAKWRLLILRSALLDKSSRKCSRAHLVYTPTDKVVAGVTQRSGCVVSIIVISLPWWMVCLWMIWRAVKCIGLTGKDWAMWQASCRHSAVWVPASYLRLLWVVRLISLPAALTLRKAVCSCIHWVMMDTTKWHSLSVLDWWRMVGHSPLWQAALGVTDMCKEPVSKVIVISSM